MPPSVYGEDQYSRDNRADYYNDSNGLEYAFLGGKFAICYFDGIHPSLAVQCYNRNKQTGHHYYVCEWKFDWAGGKPQNWHHANTWAMKSANPPAAEFHQCRVADVDGDPQQCGLSGSPTKVKAVQNIVFQAKECKRLTAADADIEGMVKELLSEKIIG